MFIIFNVYFLNISLIIAIELLIKFDYVLTCIGYRYLHLSNKIIFDVTCRNPVLGWGSWLLNL